MNKSEIAEIQTKLIHIAAEIIRREYLPSLEKCRTIADARFEIARFEDKHISLSLKIREVAYELRERAIAESRDDKIAEVRQFLTNMKRDASDAEDPELADYATAIEQILDLPQHGRDVPPSPDFEKFMRDTADKRFPSYRSADGFVFTDRNSGLLWECWQRAEGDTRELKAALRKLLPRAGHPPACMKCLPTEEWEKRGSWVVDDCRCGIAEAEKLLG